MLCLSLLLLAALTQSVIALSTGDVYSMMEDEIQKDSDQFWLKLQLIGAFLFVVFYIMVPVRRSYKLLGITFAVMALAALFPRTCVGIYQMVSL